MIVLGLDTALGACSAALIDGDRARAAASEAMARGHQERLAAMVRDLMAEAGARFAELDRIGVTVGPGSFTGLRVGLAFAKGLGFALGRPVAGVGTLAALADGIAGARVAAIDAGRGRLWVQTFDAAGAAAEPRNVSLDELAAWPDDGPPLTLTGPGAGLLACVLPHGRVVERLWPAPGTIARLAAVAAAAAEPLYLRPPDAIAKARAR